MHPDSTHLKPLDRRRFLTGAVAGIAGATLGWPGLARWASAAEAAVTENPRCDYLAQNWAPAVQEKLAHRDHRFHHYLWHALRNSWSTLPADKRTAIQKLGWAPPRPSLTLPPWFKPGGPEVGLPVQWAIGPAGEDFLFFHRWMIGLTNQWLAEAGKGPLDSWSRLDAIPAPKRGCRDEGVPDFVPRFADGPAPEFLTIRVRELKSDSFFWSRMNWWDSESKDPATLRSLTLGQFGARLEFSVHNQMHIRWSAAPSNGYVLRPDEREEIDTFWDDPGYDTLFDEYSSHVNPIFFRLHVWIDNRIEDWAAAHSDHVEPYEANHGGVKFRWYRNKPGTGRPWIEVKDHWMGGPGDLKKMEEVQRVLARKAKKAAPLAEAAPEEPELGIILLQDIF